MKQTIQHQGEFIKYLKDRKGLLLMLFIFIAVFFITFAMYQLPLTAVLYPFLLCTAIGLVFLLGDYVRFRNRHLILRSIAGLSAAMIGNFGSAVTTIDEDYQKIIFSLQKEISDSEMAADARYQDMIDYYTTWAHQIKTPIASMRLTLQNEDSHLSRHLQGDLFRIEQYVEMVLAYLRLDSSSTDYVFKEHSIDRMVKETVKKFSNEFIGRKISLEYKPIAQRVVTDEKWFCFVLEQILSNALKYTKEGKIKIYFSAPQFLSVEDTGIGIAPEDLPRIFQKGYTGCNGRLEKQSSGIGLYLCQRVCHNLGIRMKVQSEVGKGTVVTLNLSQYIARKE
ncbi:MAG: sensor histidine kinase [Eubacteriales bacterium]|nr:sensor histidine kinase [Eubacteriales bacterium]